MSGPLALLAAWVVFALWARAWHVYRRLADHSPTGVVPLSVWVKALVRGGPDPAPDPDPEPSAGYRLIDDEDSPRTAVAWERSPEPEPAAPAPASAPSRLQRWVGASLDRGARPADIITQGRRLFGRSESTMKREIRRVRSGRAGRAVREDT